MKRLASSLFALVAAVMLFAAPRTVNEAQDLASQFLSGQQTGLRLAAQSPQLHLAHTALTVDEQPAFYVFNTENEGFVLVSADERRSLPPAADSPLG